ncbi:hypothetical protein [Macrococcus sp. DPC7161]|uniref:hypothetical protein n=1 Tax=Macrococcus sp. DPC7161 TaxID=2507060 RepID=UPI00100BCA13|nr:hypothetical protein [Macrococcus sp. DPC7161]RXK18424.1 hypothetical protein ER639_03870 [Macrococcus sp. DPC7161]
MRTRNDILSDLLWVRQWRFEDAQKQITIERRLLRELREIEKKFQIVNSTCNHESKIINK